MIRIAAPRRTGAGCAVAMGRWEAELSGSNDSIMTETWRLLGCLRCQPAMRRWLVDARGADSPSRGDVRVQGRSASAAAVSSICRPSTLSCQSGGMCLRQSLAAPVTH